MAKRKGAAKKPPARQPAKQPRAKQAAKRQPAAKKAAKRQPAKQAAKRPPAKQAAKRPPAKQAAKPAKPARASRPSLPLPPPPPAPPPVRDELAAPLDVGRLLHYGERFGAKKIDIRMLPLQLPVPSGMLAIGDAGVAKTWKVLDRPTGAGSFRVMLSIARPDAPGAPAEELAAVVIHVGRPPIVRWTVAHARGSRPPRSADQIPRWTVTTGWIALCDAGTDSPAPLAVGEPAGIMPVEIALTDGRRALALPSGNGELAAYWGIDAQDKPVCLVIDCAAFTKKEWRA